MRLFLLFIALIIFNAIETGARSAIVIAHYGSSDEATRTATIDKMTDEIRDAFPSMEVRDAYISPVVRKKLMDKGIKKDSPVDALLRLKIDGYDTIYVQSSTIIDGTEMQSVRNDVELMRPFFNLILTGTPLLYTPDNFKEVAKALETDIPERNGHATVYVGHGNMLPSTASYAMLDYIFKSDNRPDLFMSTIEGYPTVDSTIGQLKGSKVKSVTLVPFLLVCGNHSRHDIDGDFRNALQDAGIEASTIMRGLGELPAIRAIYIKRIHNLITKV